MNKIDNSGGCIISNNILTNKGVLKWCFREKSTNKIDTGWRFLSDIDTDEFLASATNFKVCSINTIINIEPAVISILALPIGTDLALNFEGDKKFFVDSYGQRIL